MYELTAEDKGRIMLEEKRRNEMDYYSYIRRAEEQAQQKGMKQGIQQGIQIGAEKAISLMKLLTQEEQNELTSTSGDEQKEILTRLMEKYYVE